MKTKETFILNENDKRFFIFPPLGLLLLFERENLRCFLQIKKENVVPFHYHRANLVGFIEVGVQTSERNETVWWVSYNIGI